MVTSIGYRGPKMSAHDGLADGPWKVDGSISPGALTGGRVNYYLVHIDHPQREDQPAYTAECEDIISELNMTFDEANIFKEIWRSANARKGNGKPDHKALYGAQKMVHYSERNLRRIEREGTE